MALHYCNEICIYIWILVQYIETLEGVLALVSFTSLPYSNR